jgi:hypothetical protein
MKQRGRGGLGAAKSWFLAAGICLFLIALMAVQPRQARADGGVWPSPTPTFGPSPTPGGFVPFRPTATIPAFVVPEITVQPTVVAIATFPATETAVVATPIINQSTSRTLCWPFALGFIIILILGSIALIGRRV